MIPLSAAEIASITGGTLTAAATGTRAAGAMVTGPVVIDSRQAVPGALFAALPGERVDGHDYAAAAARLGAAAVLAARPLPGAGAPVIVVPDVTLALGLLARAVLARLPSAAVIGITGSSGKTSTKDLTAQVVEHLGPTIAPEGSLNNEIGLPLTVLRADEKTKYLVLEMSARGIGHIAYLTGIAPPRIGAVLNVGHAHAGEFGSIDAVAKAKGELVEALPAGSAGGVAVLNADDPNVAAMASRTAARVVTTSVATAGAERKRTPTCARPVSPSTTWDAPRSRCTRGRVPRRSGLTCTAATTWPTRWPRRRWRPSSAWRSRRSRTHCHPPPRAARSGWNSRAAGTAWSW